MQHVAEMAERWRSIQSDGQLGAELFSLPSLVVVGEQNAGKSSVLRLLIGYDILPCDKTICTRCPIVISIIHQAEASPSVRFDGELDYQPLDEAQVQRRILGLQEQHGQGATVCSKEIRISLRTNTSPTLTIVDLPGRVRNQVEYADAIDQLILEYISDPSCIILAVTPLAGTPDLDNSSALELAAAADPRRERTVGILTKVDLIDAGLQDSLLQLLRSNTCKHGHFAIKGPSWSELQQGVDARSVEEAWFKEHISEPECLTRCGTLQLSAYLSTHYLQELASAVRAGQHELPKLKSRLEAQLEMLAPVDRLQARSEIDALVRCFCKEYIGQVEGRLMTKTNAGTATAKKKIEARMRHEVLNVVSHLSNPELPSHREMDDLIKSRGDFLFLSDEIFHAANEKPYRQAEHGVQKMVSTVEEELIRLVDEIVIDTGASPSSGVDETCNRIRRVAKEHIATLAADRIRFAKRLLALQRWNNWIAVDDFTERTRATQLSSAWGNNSALETTPEWRDEKWSAPDFHHASRCEYSSLGGNETCGAQGYTGFGWHHCRACGITVCSHHAQGSMWLPGMGTVRCCDRCIDRDWSWVHAGSEDAIQAEQSAMESEGAVVILNTASEESLEASIFGGAAWTHLYALSGTARVSILPGHLAIAQAPPGPDSSITFIRDSKPPQELKIGRVYSFNEDEDQLVPVDEPKIASGAFLHFDRVQAAAAESRWIEIESSRRCREQSGLSLADWEQAEGMLAMCSQYLQLVGKKLKDELPKAVFRELVQEPADSIEATLSRMLQVEVEDLVALSVHEPPERAEQRRRLQGQLKALDQIKHQVSHLNKLALEQASWQSMSMSMVDTPHGKESEEMFFESTPFFESAPC